MYSRVQWDLGEGLLKKKKKTFTALICVVHGDKNVKVHFLF